MVIPMLTAVLSTVWALGLMGHTGIVIDSWNVAVPILLIAIAAAHSAQMLKRYVEEVARTGDNRAAVIESTVKMGPVMIAAGLTAALGFGSLALFGVRAVANLGLSCAYGIGSAVLLEMTFIPALRAVLPAPRRGAGPGWTARVLGGPASSAAAGGRSRRHCHRRAPAPDVPIARWPTGSTCRATAWRATTWRLGQHFPAP
jgi:predicted RND superfamily exporter protein